MKYRFGASGRVSRGLSWFVLAAGFVLAVAACRTQLPVARPGDAPRPDGARDPEALAAMLREWNGLAPLPALPPGFTYQDLLDLFPTKLSSHAESYLVQREGAAAAVLPALLRVFHDAMGERLPTPTTGLLHPTPVQRTRVACVLVLRSLGPVAREAVPDLLELLRREATQEEHYPPPHGLETGVAAVAVGRPDAVVEASYSSDYRVRWAMVRVMRSMKPARVHLKPRLLELLDDTEEVVASDAASALFELDWVEPDVLERVRDRAERVTDPAFRRRWKVLLESWERELSERGRR